MRDWPGEAGVKRNFLQVVIGVADFAQRSVIA
ncbi:hypothetical protein SAMN05444158_6494 [Bradyrhizobium canariense]|uniref:Uncharacterized protein n=1 Tax=Bradyrhizobium canariense TaxID=255045 RepID=A0A1H2AV36_9BRAD|nr:hypothetical protein SAMN05444158_6494 [Bradyrhizobium canariense]